MIYAYLINKNFDVISDDYMIRGDKFEKLVDLAERFATPAAIVWQRSTDGQVAYWGAQGATLTPYFF
jgi:hypothetical protein